jgi:hypothetical protein
MHITKFIEQSACNTIDEKISRELNE